MEPTDQQADNDPFAANVTGQLVITEDFWTDFFDGASPDQLDEIDMFLQDMSGGQIQHGLHHQLQQHGAAIQMQPGPPAMHPGPPAMQPGLPVMQGPQPGWQPYSLDTQQLLQGAPLQQQAGQQAPGTAGIGRANVMDSWLDDPTSMAGAPAPSGALIGGPQGARALVGAVPRSLSTGTSSGWTASGSGSKRSRGQEEDEATLGARHKKRKDAWTEEEFWVVFYAVNEILRKYPRPTPWKEVLERYSYLFGDKADANILKGIWRRLCERRKVVWVDSLCIWQVDQLYGKELRNRSKVAIENFWKSLRNGGKIFWDQTIGLWQVAPEFADSVTNFLSSTAEDAPSDGPPDAQVSSGMDGSQGTLEGAAPASTSGIEDPLSRLQAQMGQMQQDMQDMQQQMRQMQQDMQENMQQQMGQMQENMQQQMGQMQENLQQQLAALVVAMNNLTAVHGNQQGPF